MTYLEFIGSSYELLCKQQALNDLIMCHMKYSFILVQTGENTDWSNIFEN